MKRKLYIEDEKTLTWLAKNVPKMKESEFIRTAVKEKIQRIKEFKLSTGKF